jgi:hypothetical protein
MINKMRQATIEEIQSDDLVEVDADVESAQ